MTYKHALVSGLTVGAALLIFDVGLSAGLINPEACQKAAFYNTDHAGTRDGCGSTNGCSWRECMIGGGGAAPSNYEDDCGTGANCQFG